MSVLILCSASKGRERAKDLVCSDALCRYIVRPVWATQMNFAFFVSLFFAHFLLLVSCSIFVGTRACMRVCECARLVHFSSFFFVFLLLNNRFASIARILLHVFFLVHGFQFTFLHCVRSTRTSTHSIHIYQCVYRLYILWYFLLFIYAFLRAQDFATFELRLLKKNIHSLRWATSMTERNRVKKTIANAQIHTHLSTWIAFNVRA